MATESTIEVLGLKELNELLKTLPANIEGNVVRGAMRAGQTVIASTVKKRLSRMAMFTPVHCSKACESALYARVKRNTDGSEPI